MGHRFVTTYTHTAGKRQQTKKKSKKWQPNRGICARITGQTGAGERHSKRDQSIIRRSFPLVSNTAWNQTQSTYQNRNIKHEKMCTLAHTHTHTHISTDTQTGGKPRGKQIPYERLY